MRIATWNVNSIRARVERVGAWLDRSDVDVVAIQELKAAEAKVPLEVFTERGYEVALHGVNQWNGVLLASRIGLDDVRVGFAGVPAYDDAVEARAISAVCGGTRVYSLYVPNGREIDHPHYAYKLDWLAALRAEVAGILAARPDESLALCGDFNVAPLDTDVWDMAAFEGLTHVTAPERAAFFAFLGDGEGEPGLTDLLRRYVPEPGNYTFWDYQKLRFPKREGMRIDFVLASAALAARATDTAIDREERKGKGASDHAPVIATFA